MLSVHEDWKPSRRAFLIPQWNHQSLITCRGSKSINERFTWRSASFLAQLTGLRSNYTTTHSIAMKAVISLVIWCVAALSLHPNLKIYSWIHQVVCVASAHLISQGIYVRLNVWEKVFTRKSENARQTVRNPECLPIKVDLMLTNLYAEGD